MASKKKATDRYIYLLACMLGIVLMAIVYILFEPLAKRARSGSEDPVDRGTARVLSDAVRAGATEQPPPGPSVFLGVEIISVDSVITEQLGISSKKGVLINSVVPSSPAQAAGLQRGDVIVALNNRTVKDVDGFREIMSKLAPGDRVRIVYVRNGMKDQTYAELGPSPALMKTAQEETPGSPAWGVSLAPVSPALRESLGIPPDINGIAILSVAPGAAADRAGLAPGNVIVGIDKTPVSDMDDFFGAVASDEDRTALLDVYARDGMRYVPMDSSGIAPPAPPQNQMTLRQRVFSLFTGGAPFSSDEDDEEGPKGGKFAQDGVQLTADTTGFARPSSVPGDTNTGGPAAGGSGFSRPSTVPGETNTGGPVSSPNDLVLFIGLLLVALLYLTYREYHRPPEVDGGR
jgi:membrane-associated protease RseP (regulator of RpoE activity)